MSKPIHSQGELDMQHVRCQIAETRRQIDEALRIRYTVFAEECDYLDPARRLVPREVDPFDTLDTTYNIVAYVEDRAVGTVRMHLPNLEVATVMGSQFGFDIESKFDIGGLAQTTMRLAETMRYCILTQYRHTHIASALHAAVVQISNRTGITHWIGCANTETDSLEDANLIHSIGRRSGRVHGQIHIEPREHTLPIHEPRHPFFTTAERHAAHADAVNARFPRILAIYSQKMGARLIGPPTYDHRFRMYSIPVLMAVDVQRINASHLQSSLEISSLAA